MQHSNDWFICNIFIKFWIRFDVGTRRKRSTSPTEKREWWLIIRMHFKCNFDLGKIHHVISYLAYAVEYRPFLRPGAGSCGDEMKTLSLEMLHHFNLSHWLVVLACLHKQKKNSIYRRRISWKNHIPRTFREAVPRERICKGALDNLDRKIAARNCLICRRDFITSCRT